MSSKWEVDLGENEGQETFPYYRILTYYSEKMEPRKHHLSSLSGTDVLHGEKGQETAR